MEPLISSPDNKVQRTFTRRHFLTAAGALALSGCGGPWLRRRKTADVVIVGAGLAGLYAAMLLQDAGFNVVVFEASHRVGGRLYTLDDLPGQPEAGGTQVGRSYARLRYIAERLNVSVIDSPRSEGGRDRLICLGGARIPQSEWQGAPHNPFPDRFRPAPPDSALFAAARASGNPFRSPGDWREAQAARFDRSAADFLASVGFDVQARQLVDVALNGNTLETYSMLNVWRTMQLYTADAALGPAGRIQGGSQRLPEAMAAALGDGVRTGVRVTRVEQEGDSVIIRTHRDVFVADHCILAVPFPAVRTIHLAPSPRGPQMSAIAGLPYTQIVLLFLEPKRPFWDRDGLPPDMWTDGPLERIFATRNRRTGEIVGLLAWINGEPARALGARSDEMLETLAQTELRRLRPASEGAVRLRKAVRWTDGASYAGGAYMHWAPGQAGKWASRMGAPMGRVVFAGEHLSHRYTGMEGAMESGEAAAGAIIAQSL